MMTQQQPPDGGAVGDAAVFPSVNVASLPWAFTQLHRRVHQWFRPLR